MAWEDGCVYEGAFASDRKEGYGVFRWPYGRSWAGPPRGTAPVPELYWNVLKMRAPL